MYWFLRVYSTIIKQEFTLNTLHKYLLSILAITMVNGYVSIKFMKSNRNMYKSYYEEVMYENERLGKELDEFYAYGISVDVTMYQPTYQQTDNTPNITADGTKIRISKASQYKFVALSRNLLARWGGPFDYGDFILLKGTDGKDGVYQVRDTMNPKWVNVVDILESKHVQPYKFTNVNIFKLPWLSKEKKSKENA